MSTVLARERHTVLDMDPVRNPYAPGAGQRPPELAGRDIELSAFDVVLERMGHREDRGPARAVAAPSRLVRAAHGAARAGSPAQGPGVDRGGARRPEGLRPARDTRRREGPGPLAARHRRARRN